MVYIILQLIIPAMEANLSFVSTHLQIKVCNHIQPWWVNLHVKM